VRWLTGILAGVLVTVCARGAAAQAATFGFGIGGQGTALIRTADIDARLAAAGRSGIGGPAGGLLFGFEGSIGPVLGSLSIDASFMGKDPTRDVNVFNGAFLLGVRIRQDRWVFRQSVGPSFTELNLCVKGPAGAVPSAGGPLFDQILSAAGKGECLRSESTGVRFELGVDREFWVESKDAIAPSFFIGARAALTLPLDSGWTWGDTSIDGPLAPMVAPMVGLVAGFRVRLGE
jgi:hypothetical protein